MKTQLNIPKLSFLLMMGIALASTKAQAAASGIKTTTSFMQSPLVYERLLNPYININTDERAIGSTYAIRDSQGRIIRTGVVTAAKTFTVPTGKLGTGSYTVYVGGYMIQQFIVK